MAPSTALPLKVTSTPAKNGDNDKDKTPLAASKQNTSAKAGNLVPSDISSPHELTAFVCSRPYFPIVRMY
jgi:heat shock factor-binding protein 1